MNYKTAAYCYSGAGFVAFAVSLLLVPWGGAGRLSGQSTHGFEFLGTIAGILLLCAAFGLAITKHPLGMLRDGQNTYSLSRLQMTLWTVLILSALTAAAAGRIWRAGGVPGEALNIYIPVNLFYVMGISYFSGAAAPSLLSVKMQTGPADAAVQAAQLAAAQTRMDEPNMQANGQVIVRPANDAPKFGDMVEGDEVATAGTVDISKVQQLLITLLLVGVYFAMLWGLFNQPDILTMPDDTVKALVSSGTLLCGYPDAASAQAAKCGAGWSGLPDFPGSMVTLLAVSHGGYLAYKAAPRVAANQA